MLGAIMTLSVVGMLNYMGQSGESCHTYFNERQLDAKPKYEELDSSLTSNAKNDIEATLSTKFELEQNNNTDKLPQLPETLSKPTFAMKNFSSDNVPAKLEDMQKYSDLNKMIEEAYMTYNMRESFVQSHIDPEM